MAIHARVQANARRCRQTHACIVEVVTSFVSILEKEERKKEEKKRREREEKKEGKQKVHDDSPCSRSIAEKCCRYEYERGRGTRVRTCAFCITGVTPSTEISGYPSPMMPSNFAAMKANPGSFVDSANVWC